MLLAVDVGNTQTALGLYPDGELTHHWRLATERSTTADELGVLDADTRKPLHVHVPAGAIPKDGPSAGVTMTTALVSLLSGRPVRPEVGMTGEVTLQGRVLPIGGVKQKVLAAERAGLTEVVLPARNGADLDDVPEKVRDSLEAVRTTWRSPAWESSR